MVTRLRDAQQKQFRKVVDDRSRTDMLRKSAGS